MQMDEPPSLLSAIMRSFAIKRPLMAEIRSFKDKVILQATKTFNYSNRAPSFGCIAGDRGKSETPSVIFSDDSDSPPSYNDVAPRDASPPDESSSVYQNLHEENFEEARSTALNFREIYGMEDDEIGENNGEVPSGSRPSSQLLAFSGAYTSNQVREIFDTEMEHDNSSETSTIYEESESISISIGEVIKSPIFSEDESSDDSFWIDLGQDPLPLGSDGDGAQANHEHRDSTSPLPPVWFTGKN